MPTLEFICLADSAKRGDHCLAGIRTDGGGWIRPIGTRLEGALSDWEAACQDGKLPKTLDVLRGELEAPTPKCHQPENWRCPARFGTSWQRVRVANAKDIDLLLRNADPGPDLFGNGEKSLAYVDLQAKPAAASLALVEPTTLRWQAKRWRVDEPIKVEADFSLQRQHYWLKVTDPVWKTRIQACGEGLHSSEDLGVDPRMSRILLTVSLSEPYARPGEPLRCWKLVAGVLVLPRHPAD